MRPQHPQAVAELVVLRPGALPGASPASCPVPLFAREDFRRVAGDTLRPGGLALTRRALALAKLPDTALVADLGCGRGATARLLAQAGHRVLALDPAGEDLRAAACPPGVCGAPEQDRNTQPALAHAQSPGEILFLRARAQALPLPAASLDAVFCECVLSASGAASAILAEAARALKPGATLVLSDLYLRGGSTQAIGGVSRTKGIPPAQAGHASPARKSSSGLEQAVDSPPTQTTNGGCLSGALPQDELLRALDRAGFCVTHFEDHSRLLAELAGRLLFAGLPRSALGFACGEGGSEGRSEVLADTRADTQAGASGAAQNGCGCPGARPGYFLCLARRRGL